MICVEELACSHLQMPVLLFVPVCLVLHVIYQLHASLCVCWSQCTTCLFKCLQPFPTSSFGEKADFSGYDQNTWQQRSNEFHRHYAKIYRDCNTRDAEKKMECDMVIDIQCYWTYRTLMWCVCV